MPDPRMAGQAPAPQQGGGQNPIQQAQMEIAQMPRPELEKLAMQLIMELQEGQQQQAQGGQRQPQRQPQGQQQMR